jgi:hypothetical protein
MFFIHLYLGATEFVSRPSSTSELLCLAAVFATVEAVDG